MAMLFIQSTFQDLEFYVQHSPLSVTNDITENLMSDIHAEFRVNDTDSDDTMTGNNDNDDDLPEGFVCLDKVVMTEELEYDTEMLCHHAVTENCYQTYQTVFMSAPVSDNLTL